MSESIIQRPKGARLAETATFVTIGALALVPFVGAVAIARQVVSAETTDIAKDPAVESGPTPATLAEPPGDVSGAGSVDRRDGDADADGAREVGAVVCIDARGAVTVRR
ncbi:MAG TPA: hypothetical protein VL400_18225 [Polyangiaceae bacterium]|nr:hypothetical protein [Polyangiaceae bacterium]